MNTKFTGYWTFFCNPKKWAIDRFLSSGAEYDDYQITDWQEKEFVPGQLGIIRVGVDYRTRTELAGRKKLLSGVYGLVQILSSPKKRSEELDEFWGEGKEAAINRSIVEIKYLNNLLVNPLLLSDLKHDSKITNEYLLNGFQASSMPLDKGSFDRIVELIGNEHLFDNIKAEPINTLEEVQKTESKYASAVPEVKEIISKRIERGTIGNKVKKLAGYKCMVCESMGLNPISFYKKDGIPYVEAHHVTYVSKLEAGSLSSSNVIAICANHHRQIHYGDSEVILNDGDSFVFKIDGRKVKIDKIKI